MNTFTENWKRFFSYKQNKLNFALTVASLVLLLIFYGEFLKTIELRDGVNFYDPILFMIKPINFSIPVFILIYFSLLAAVYILIKYPEKILLALQAYGILIIFRIVAMYLVPFNPPHFMLTLDDPLVQYLAGTKPLTKDLFFSGHTATLFLLFLLVDSKKIKPMFLIITFVVAVLLLFQHTHYSIDIFTAPFFSFAAYKSAQKLNCNNKANN